MILHTEITDLLIYKKEWWKYYTKCNNIQEMTVILLIY